MFLSSTWNAWKKSSLSTALQTRKKPGDDTFTLNGWLIFKSIKY